MTVFTLDTYDPIARMNARRGLGKGGKSPGVRMLRSSDRQGAYCPIRDAIARMRLATSDAIEQYHFDVFLRDELGWEDFR